MTIPLSNASESHLSVRDVELHARATSAARAYGRAEAELMEALIAVGQARVFLRLGYPSLFQYAVLALELSESVAYAAIAVARKAEAVPALRQAVHSGTLSLTKAKKVLSVLNPRDSSDRQSAWVEKAVSLTSRKLERAVAAENPRPTISDRAIYKSSDRIELTLGVSEELMLEFRQAQNLVSNTGQAQDPGGASLEETLATVLKFYLERKDPGRRARRIIAKKGSHLSEANDGNQNRASDSSSSSGAASEQCTGTVSDEKISRDTGGLPLNEKKPTRPSLPPIRRPIPTRTLHAIRLRDRNSCQASLPNGKKCGSRRWLDIHHRVPVHLGGKNAMENLITLCRAHHQAVHAQQPKTDGNSGLPS